MGLTLQTAAAETPISVAEAKAYARVDSSAEDAQFADWIAAAVAEGERLASGRAFVAQVWDWTLPTFPAGRCLELPLAPLVSVGSVSYLDADGDSQTFAPANYAVDVASTPGRLALLDSAVWPTTQADALAGVTIRFTAGWADAASVPADIKLALKELVAGYYCDREGRAAATASRARQILMNYSVRRFA